MERPVGVILGGGDARLEVGVEGEGSRASGVDAPLAVVLLPSPPLVPTDIPGLRSRGLGLSSRGLGLGLDSLGLGLEPLRLGPALPSPSLLSSCIPRSSALSNAKSDLVDPAEPMRL